METGVNNPAPFYIAVDRAEAELVKRLYSNRDKCGGDLELRSGPIALCRREKNHEGDCGWIGIVPISAEPEGLSRGVSLESNEGLINP